MQSNLIFTSFSRPSVFPPRMKQEYLRKRSGDPGRLWSMRDAKISGIRCVNKKKNVAPILRYRLRLTDARDVTNQFCFCTRLKTGYYYVIIIITIIMTNCNKPDFNSICKKILEYYHLKKMLNLKENVKVFHVI